MKTGVVAILSMMYGVMVSAQPGPGNGMSARLMDELNLSDQQKPLVERIQHDAMKQAIDRRAEIGKARVDLRQLFQADIPDQTAIEKKMGEISGMQSAAATHRVQTWFAINKLLNADQQKIWKQHQERRTGAGARMGMRGRMRNGMGRDFEGPRSFRDRRPR